MITNQVAARMVVQAAAGYLGISKRKLEGYIADGVFTIQQASENSTRYLLRAELDAWVAGGGEQGGAEAVATLRKKSKR